MISSVARASQQSTGWSGLTFRTLNPGFARSYDPERRTERARQPVRIGFSPHERGVSSPGSGSLPTMGAAGGRGTDHGERVLGGWFGSWEGHDGV